MTVTNCKISTEIEYMNKTDREKVHKVYIAIPIPGGEAIFKIPSTSQINDAIETASAMLVKSTIHAGEN